MYISSIRLRYISPLNLMSWLLKSYNCFFKMFYCLIVIKLRSTFESTRISFSRSDNFSLNLNFRLKHANRRLEYVHSEYRCSKDLLRSSWWCRINRFDRLKCNLLGLKCILDPRSQSYREFVTGGYLNIHSLFSPLPCRKFATNHWNS